MNSKSTVRRAVVAVVAAAVAAGLVTAGMWANGGERATAAEIKTRCIEALRTGRSWKATVVETETGTDGAKSVLRRDIAVQSPDTYRLTMTERDERGRAVVSTTLRTGTTLYSRRTEEDGSVVLRVTKGVPPELGVMMDNIVGEMVGSVIDSAQLKQVGTEAVGGRSAYKLETEPEHYVWIDEASGLPLKEQISSGGKVNHEVDIESIDIDANISSDMFAAASLGEAARTEIEDLGFRPTGGPRLAARQIGFTPLALPAPTGFTAGTQGYIDPEAPIGGGSYIASFERGTQGVLVTQVRRDGLGEDTELTGDDPRAGSDGPTQVSIKGRTALYFADRTAPRLQFAVGDVLLTIEGPLGMQAMVSMAENARSMPVSGSTQP